MAASKLALLESRVANLEAELALLKQRQTTSVSPLPWWEERWGVFDNDPDYEKAMELGRKYRESLRPKPAKGRGRKKAVKKKSAKASRG